MMPKHIRRMVKVLGLKNAVWQPHSNTTLVALEFDLDPESMFSQGVFLFSQDDLTHLDDAIFRRAVYSRIITDLCS